MNRLKMYIKKLVCQTLLSHDWLVNISNNVKSGHCSKCKNTWGPYET